MTKKNRWTDYPNILILKFKQTNHTDYQYDNNSLGTSLLNINNYTCYNIVVQQAKHWMQRTGSDLMAGFSPNVFNIDFFFWCTWIQFPCANKLRRKLIQNVHLHMDLSQCDNNKRIMKFHFLDIYILVGSTLIKTKGKGGE